MGYRVLETVELRVMLRTCIWYISVVMCQMLMIQRVTNTNRSDVRVVLQIPKASVAHMARVDILSVTRWEDTGMLWFDRRYKVPPPRDVKALADARRRLANTYAALIWIANDGEWPVIEDAEIAAARDRFTAGAG